MSRASRGPRGGPVGPAWGRFPGPSRSRAPAWRSRADGVTVLFGQLPLRDKRSRKRFRGLPARGPRGGGASGRGAAGSAAAARGGALRAIAGPGAQTLLPGDAAPPLPFPSPSGRRAPAAPAPPIATRPAPARVGPASACSLAACGSHGRSSSSKALSLSVGLPCLCPRVRPAQSGGHAALPSLRPPRPPGWTRRQGPGGASCHLPCSRLCGQTSSGLVCLSACLVPDWRFSRERRQWRCVRVRACVPAGGGGQSLLGPRAQAPPWSHRARRPGGGGAGPLPCPTLATRAPMRSLALRPNPPGLPSSLRCTPTPHLSGSNLGLSAGWALGSVAPAGQPCTCPHSGPAPQWGPQDDRGAPAVHSPSNAAQGARGGPSCTCRPLGRGPKAGDATAPLPHGTPCSPVGTRW